MLVAQHQRPLVVHAREQVAFGELDRRGEPAGRDVRVELEHVHLGVVPQPDPVAGRDERAGVHVVERLAQRPERAAHALPGARVDDVRPQARGDVGPRVQAGVHGQPAEQGEGAPAVRRRNRASVGLGGHAAEHPNAQHGWTVRR